MHEPSPPLTVSVVVPTYRRPDVLVGCLRALHRQELTPLEVIVCYRSNDDDTLSALGALSDENSRLIRRIVVGAGVNLAGAMNEGIAAARGDLVALTDDDAEAPADWLSKLAAAFTDPRIAGVGGRDLQRGKPAAARDVGRVQWFGRRIANHDIGLGGARNAQVLKGVNCCFRRGCLANPAIDARLRGRGNVAHWELDLCLPLVRAGHRLVYDPSITVTHHTAPRKDGDDNHRGGFNAQALADLVHNETVSLLDFLSPPGKVAFAVWAGLVGTRFNPGVIQALRLLLSEPPGRVASRWLATTRGRLDGLNTWLGSRAPRRPDQGAPLRESPAA